MRLLPFSELLPTVHALSDASSLEELKDHESTLVSPLSPQLAQEIAHEADNFDLRPSLNLLERWIVVDQIVVDAIAAGSMRTRLHSRLWGHAATNDTDSASQSHEQRLQRIAESICLSGLGVAAEQLDLALTVIPTDVINGFLPSLFRTAKSIRETHPAYPWDQYGFGIEKQYGESLGDNYFEMGDLARSNLGVERTLFYYETAAAAKIPLVLHPERDDQIENIGKACTDAFKAVTRTTQQSFESGLATQLANLGQPCEAPMPPLARMVISFAGKAGISLLAAAAEIKAAPQAAEFRRWLGEIQTHLVAGTSAEKLAGLKLIDELRRTVESWNAHFDVREGVNHRRRALSLKWVPRIGALLGLLGPAKVKDPILNRKGYLAFVSSWYE